MTTLENGDKNYDQLINELITGQIKIPQFQREFVWDIKASARLIDSILKGYPIGTFIYWKTQERLRTVRNIGRIELQDPIEGDFVNYILDGQQRITSIFAAMKGETITRFNGKQEDFSKIYLDLEANPENDEPIVIVNISDKGDKTYVGLSDLLSETITYFATFADKYHKKIDKYRSTLISYHFKGINLKEAHIDVATEVFTRLNVGGKELTVFEIMVAKMYDTERVFDLAERFDELIAELKEAGYETISSANVLQLIALMLKGNCKKKTILGLSRDDFIDIWPKAIDCIKSACDYLKGTGIPVSKLLPYNAIIVPYSYFFSLHKDMPSRHIADLLEDFFWRVSLSERYSSAVESSLTQDINKIREIAKGEQPVYEWDINISPDRLKLDGYFSTSRSFIKAILCLYTKQKPKSFNNHLDVNIENDWLKIASSKNYHHFFPKGYMKNHHPKFDKSQYNHILNITIVDSQLNKKHIHKKDPARYMQEFHEQNPKLAETMTTHLIDNLEDYGIWDNDYEKFFNERAERVSEELRSKIIPLDKPVSKKRKSIERSIDKTT